MNKRPVSLRKLNYKQLSQAPPNVVVLPWGATEAHNYHLPFAADVIEAEAFAEESARMAAHEGARVVVLPAIPFGSNAQHLDQVSTIHLTTTTAGSILRDIVHSLNRQNIDRLVIINAHGGNEFKPHIRDLQEQYPVLIILVNILEILPELVSKLFDQPGDHAGELETSLLLHLCPENVDLSSAGPGTRKSFKIEGIGRPGIWTPRPWRRVHPDLGSGNPSKASAESGHRYFDAVINELKSLLINVSKATKGDLPYI